MSVRKRMQEGNAHISSNMTPTSLLVAGILTAASAGVNAEEAEIHGYFETDTHVRLHGEGLSKMRNTLNLEISKH